MKVQWMYDGEVWWLVIRNRAIYSIASNQRPDRGHTGRIIRRLYRFYPWLRETRVAA